MAGDIISTLPDSILSHILSFLPTKDSVATSILSKRWNHLYLSLPILDFTDIILTTPDSNFRFNDFIYSLFFSRDPSLPIKTFRFDVHYDYNDNTNLLRIPSFIKWINFVLQRGVDYLDLRLSMTWCWEAAKTCLPKLPITILICKTLVVLKLCFVWVDHTFSFVKLPLLKTLDLQFITLQEDQDFMLVLSGCPILENLIIFDLSYESEADSLRCDRWKSFRLSNLIQADVVDSSYLHFPFQALQNVNSLCIEIAQEYCRNDAIPTFHNLTRLDLTSLNYHWNVLVAVLKHCPMLQYLSLHEAYEDEESLSREYNVENWEEPDVVPQCLSLHLKTCKLFTFLGLQGELMLAKYILKNARVLQTMKIFNKGHPEITSILSSCPKASSTCKLMVYLV